MRSSLAAVARRSWPSFNNSSPRRIPRPSLSYPRPKLRFRRIALGASPLPRAKVLAHRQHAARKLKMARLLGEGELGEEARTALLEAVLPLGRALALENRLPEPSTLDETLLPPLAHQWREALTSLRHFAGDA